MEKKEEINYLRIALNLQGINVDEKMCDRIISTYTEILKKKGKFSLDDCTDIELDIDRKYTKAKTEARAEKSTPKESKLTIEDFIHKYRDLMTTRLVNGILGFRKWNYEEGKYDEHPIFIDDVKFSRIINNPGVGRTTAKEFKELIQSIEDDKL